MLICCFISESISNQNHWNYVFWTKYDMHRLRKRTRKDLLAYYLCRECIFRFCNIISGLLDNVIWHSFLWFNFKSLLLVSNSSYFLNVLFWVPVSMRFHSMTFACIVIILCVLLFRLNVHIWRRSPLFSAFVICRFTVYFYYLLHITHKLEM